MVALLIPVAPASPTLNLDIASTSEVFGKFCKIFPIYIESGYRAERTLHTLDLAQNLYLLKIDKLLKGIASDSLDIFRNCNLCDLCTVFDIGKERLGNSLTLEYYLAAIIIILQVNCRFS